MSSNDFSYKQGHAYWCHLASNRGAEEAGYRPCVVISSDTFNRIYKTCIVVPLTRNTKGAYKAGHVSFKFIGSEETSVAMCEQATVIDQRFMGAPEGELPKSAFNLIHQTFTQLVLYNEFKLPTNSNVVLENLNETRGALSDFSEQLHSGNY